MKHFIIRNHIKFNSYPYKSFILYLNKRHKYYKFLNACVIQNSCNSPLINLANRFKISAKNPTVRNTIRAIQHKKRELLSVSVIKKDINIKWFMYYFLKKQEIDWTRVKIWFWDIIHWIQFLCYSTRRNLV